MPADSGTFAADVVTQNLYLEISQAEDPATARAASRLLAHARSLHRELDARYFSTGVEIVLSINSLTAPRAGAELYGSLRDLHHVLEQERPGLAIRVVSDNRYEIEFRAVDGDPVADAVKYLMIPGSAEQVVTAGATFDVAQPPDGSSPFSVLFFRQLSTALDEYRRDRATTSDCRYLETIWADDERIALSNKPEAQMRRSLHDYLRTRLRDADPVVLQEQNVNESKPVDIRIQWIDGHRVSLVEVKWLGKSLKDSGDGLADMWSDGRAREGYTQTLNYLHEQRLTAPDQVVNATLVVFDARRWGAKWTSAEGYTCTKPWHFELANLDYSEVETEEMGMEPPVRFFLEPALPRAA